jgi:hypothetical protein
VNEFIIIASEVKRSDLEEAMRNTRDKCDENLLLQSFFVPTLQTFLSGFMSDWLSDLFYKVILDFSTKRGRELETFRLNTVRIYESNDFLTNIGMEGHWNQSGCRLRRNRIFE